MKQVSVRQLELLIGYMENHKDLALGRVRSKEGRAVSSKLWTELADILNSELVDPKHYRSPKDWNRFYNDYKCRLKNKSRKLAQSQRKTGGGPADAPPLTELEERLCAIIGPDKFETLPVQINPLQNEETVQDIIVEQLSPGGTFGLGLSDSVEFLEFEAEPQIENVEPQSPTSPNIPYPTIADQSRTNIYMAGQAREPQSPTPLDIPNPTVAGQSSTNIHMTGQARKQPSKLQRVKSKNSVREPKENEVERMKNILTEIEKARLEANQAQIQAQLDLNNIEKSKVDAINNLASAAWALVNVFNNKEVGKTRKRARLPSSDEDSL